MLEEERQGSIVKGMEGEEQADHLCLNTEDSFLGLGLGKGMHDEGAKGSLSNFSIYQVLLCA
jgi:hypothetical protein